MAVSTTPAAPLVGRERELVALRTSLEAAAAGRGLVTLLAGDAGIGKTRIARELAEHARRRNATVLWGTCYEGAWSAPFSPWIEAVGPVVRRVPTDVLADRLGGSAPVAAEFVPGLREALPVLGPVPPLAPEESRIRAYEAFVRLVGALADETVVLVLDDLHWADQPSVGLLTYLGRFVGDSRLLVVGSHRERVELDHPLARCLAELDHLGVSRRIALEELDSTAARLLLDHAHGGPLRPELAEAILREAGGNPFFLEALGRHVREHGSGKLTVPATVRQAVGARLSRLTTESGRMLALAAAFTRPFELAVLQVLTGSEEEVLLACIDEALGERLIRPATGPSDRYEFAHALVRHTLYDELSPSRKARLHRRVAQAIERVYPGSTATFAELASQYHLSAALPGAAHGLRYALVAAEQAKTSYAHDQAVLFLRMARDLAVDSEPAVRADVLCRLAAAEAEALLLTDAAQTVDDALHALAESGADDSITATFLGEVGWTLKEAGADEQLLTPLVVRGLELAGDRRDLTWARLQLIRLPLERRQSGPLEYAIWRGFDPEALEIARSCGDELEYARSLEAMDTRTRTETEELLDLVRGWTHPAAKIHGLTVVARVLLYRYGAIRESAEVVEELFTASEAYGSLSGRGYALVLRAEIEAARGEFAAAYRTAEGARELIAQLGPGHRLRRWRAGAGLLASYVGGDWSSLARSYTDLALGAGAGWPWMSLVAAGAALAHARAGERDEATELLAALTPAIEDQEAAASGLSEAVGEAGAVVWELELPEYAERYRRLALALTGSPVNETLGSCNSLTLARMEALLGRVDEAERFFARARAELDESGQRPLRAIVDYDEAVVRRRRGERHSELLAAARAEFEALGMAFWLERADALEARADRTYPDGLTAREAEVLSLLAGGRSNREIAGELVLSVHTIERHVANVYAKIGARNRADATAYALRHGI